MEKAKKETYKKIISPFLISASEVEFEELEYNKIETQTFSYDEKLYFGMKSIKFMPKD